MSKKIILLLLTILCQYRAASQVEKNNSKNASFIKPRTEKKHNTLLKFIVHKKVHKCCFANSDCYQCIGKAIDENHMITNASLIIKNVKIILHSGVSWNISSPPKLPWYFLIKPSSPKVKLGVEYSIYLNEYEALKSIPYHMINEIHVLVVILGEDNAFCFEEEFEFQVDSKGFIY